MNPRQPTVKEKKQLAEYILRDEDTDTYDAREVDPERKAELEKVIDGAAIAVFDPDPVNIEYAEKTMIVIWPRGLEAAQGFYWIEGKLEEVTINP